MALDRRLLKNNGITIIGLVISSIIILILTSVVVATLIDGNLFEITWFAREKTENSQLMEKEILDDYINQMDKLIWNNPDDSIIEAIVSENYLNKTYSDEEVEVGTWIDGNKIYRKVIMFDARSISANAWSTIANVAGLNIKKLIYSEFLCTQGTTSLGCGYTQVSGNNLQIFPKFVMPTNGIIIEYTKKDLEDKSLTNDNPYSTEETEVGTWIDGSKIYRKVVTFTSRGITGNNWTTVGDVSDLNIKKIIHSEILCSQSTSSIGCGYTQISSGNLQIYVKETISTDGVVIEYIKNEPVDPSIGILNNNLYSLKEIEIGTWIDGSKVYRKVIMFPNTAFSTDTTMTIVNLEQFNIKKLLHSEILCTQNTTSIGSGYTEINKNNLLVHLQNGMATDGIIIEYIKDSNNTNIKEINYSDISKYTEDEIAIGKWINGHIIYRKTITFPTTSISSDVWTTIANVSGLNIKKLVHSEILCAQNTSSIGCGFTQVSGNNLQIFLKNGMTTNGIIIEYTKNQLVELNTFDTDNIYSTEEREIGRWIDGSKIYRKVVAFTSKSITANTWTTVANLSDIGIKKIINSEILCSQSTSSIGCGFTQMSSGNLQIYQLNTISTDGVIIEYIKNDDSLNSITNNIKTYSSEEIEIGTWIDGSKIYRKTITFNTASVSGNAWTQVGDISKLNVKKLVGSEILCAQNTSSIGCGVTQVVNNNLQIYLKAGMATNGIVIEYIKNTENTDIKGITIADISTYSEDEIAIGKWINGHIIYRKVITFPTISIGTDKWTTIASVAGLNIKKIIHSEILCAQNTSSIGCGFTQVSGNNLQIFLKNGMVTNGIIIEYTKNQLVEINTFDTDNIYSTEEREIGRWIDGSKVYRQVITFDSKSISGNTWTTVANLSSTGIKKLIYSEILCSQSTSSIGCGFTQISGGNLQIYQKNGISTDGVIIEYIKNETGSSSLNNNLKIYSSNEIEVGTWIDGSKIYQKTFTFDTRSITGDVWTTIADISDLNIKKLTYSEILCAQNTSSIGCGFTQVSGNNLQIFLKNGMATNGIVIEYIKK